jgi:hypothetical protein
MANVKHHNQLLSLKNAVNHTIHVRFATIQQVSEFIPGAYDRTSVRMIFQAKDVIL